MDNDVTMLIVSTRKKLKTHLHIKISKFVYYSVFISYYENEFESRMIGSRCIARGFEHSSAEGFGQKRSAAVSDRKLTAFRRHSSHPCLAEPWPTPKSRFPPMPSSGH